MSIILPDRVYFSSVPGSTHVRLERELFVIVDGRTITIRSGFSTDGNTIPWIFEWILPRYGWSLEAGIVHDSLPRSVASDTIHRKMVIFLGKRAKVWFPKTRAWIVWFVLATTIVTGIRSLCVKFFEQ